MTRFSFSRESLAGLFAVLALVAVPFSARANYVLNGSFEDAPTGSGPFSSGTCANILSACIGIPDWTTQANPAMLVTPASVATYLDNAVINGIMAADGSNFLAVDGSCCTLGVVSQQVSGLTVGNSYVLSFYQAAGELGGNYSPTSEQWQVTIGGTLSVAQEGITLPNSQSDTAYVVDTPDDSWTTPVMNTPAGGYTPWEYETYTFTANATTELLGFLALGAPVGAPPLVLLDGVDIEDNSGSGTNGTTGAAPEPASVALTVGGAGLIVVGVRRRRRRLQA